MKTSMGISPKPPFAKEVAGERVTNMNGTANSRVVHMQFTPIDKD